MMIKQITIEDLTKWQELQKEYQLIDVRESFEREVHHIGGIHIPLDELTNSLNQLPNNIPLVFYCAKGIRSTIAIQKLEGQLTNEMYNLSGGIQSVIK
jgi:rhodanese-related sulfurtransferase